MGFWKELFADENSINEKSVVGFVAFLIMIIFAIVDIVAGFVKPEFSVHEFIFDAFLWLVLGCFGIAELGNILGSKNRNNQSDNDNREQLNG